MDTLFSWTRQAWTGWRACSDTGKIVAGQRCRKENLMAKKEVAKTTVEKGVPARTTPHAGRYVNRDRKPAGKTTFGYRRNFAPEINLYGP
jgi:hypothetical protein